jgi:hypothetical protein
MRANTVCTALFAAMAFGFALRPEAHEARRAGPPAATPAPAAPTDAAAAEPEPPAYSTGWAGRFQERTASSK